MAQIVKDGLEYRESPRRKDLEKVSMASEKIDSGFGEDEGLSMLSSMEDRSFTDSNSINDKSRDQVYNDGPGSSEIEKQTEKMTLSDDQTDSACYTSFNSNISAGNSTTGKSTTGKSTNSTSATSKLLFMNSYAQTNDIRYLLAPIWQALFRRNQDGDTSLHLAVINCQQAVVKAIIDVLPKRAKECLDFYNDLTQTPLHLAVITKQPEIVGKLLDSGADVSLTDRNVQTCLHLACQRGDLKVIKAIFKKRHNSQFMQVIQELLETRNFEGQTPLHVAVLKNNIDVVKLLLSFGAYVDAEEGKSGYTALHLAVEQNNLLMVSHLLFEANANVDAQSFSGCTPLHLAAGLGYTSILATLIAAGANETLETCEGETAFDIACNDFGGILDCNYDSMEE